MNAVNAEGDATPDSVYRDFWAPLIEEGGQIVPEKLRAELFDFWQVMQRVPLVYCHVTGDQISKLLTDSDTVCAVADDHYRKLHMQDAAAEQGIGWGE